MMPISSCRPSATLPGVHREHKIITTNKTQIIKDKKTVVVGKKYQKIHLFVVLKAALIKQITQKCLKDDHLITSNGKNFVNEI